MIGLGNLFAAYTIVWIVLLAYLLFVSGSINGLRKEVQTLRDVLTEHESALDRAGRERAAAEPGAFFATPEQRSARSRRARP